MLGLQAEQAMTMERPLMHYTLHREPPAAAARQLAEATNQSLAEEQSPAPLGSATDTAGGSKPERAACQSAGRRISWLQ